MGLNSIETIVQLGDLYDRRRDVSFATIKWVTDNFYSQIKLQDINLYVIAGNHDILWKHSSRINSVSLLCPDTTKVVDIEPETVIINNTAIDFYPWINQENLEASLKLAKESKSKFAVGHFEFAKFPMHPGTIAETGMNHKLFSGYEQVFSGHYHTISLRDSILYTGTPYETSWSDWNDPKGFWILDTITGEKEFIKNPYTLFEKISYVEDMKYDFTQVSEKYVKIIIVDKKSQKKFDSFLDNVNLNKPHDVKIIESNFKETVDSAVTLTDLVSTNQMIVDVIDNMELELDKVKLKNGILELYSEAMTINNSL